MAPARPPGGAAAIDIAAGVVSDAAEDLAGRCIFDAQQAVFTWIDRIAQILRETDPAPLGKAVRGEFSSPHGSRAYRLFVPDTARALRHRWL